MTLADSFARGNARKTKLHGETVVSYLRLPVSDGDRITVTRVGASSVRAQALKIAADRGELRANGVVVPLIALWTHTAPEVATVDVVGRRVRSIDLWNGWSLGGVDSSWLGNAGMVVETTDAAHLLRCSDGLGEPSFDDLVVRVEVTSGG